MTLAETIRRAQTKVPVDLEGICREFGIRLHEAWLDTDISGELVSIPETGSYQINVNASHSTARKRFTIAHELGHFFLHRHLIGRGIDDDRVYRSTSAGRYHNTAIGPREETEANRFAASLLMPQSHIVQLQRDGVLTPEALAAKLLVSPAAMRIRLGLPVDGSRDDQFVPSGIPGDIGSVVH
ncbi:ImmA/IrrE family metallo-endopeptidase [Youhaiella tibetensis]|uniref:ImmA/IrrE family metallo-endopeptidase n=1 Tax=Paradevosia tibetensis TaxID=1447062 RepID=A0A5B9DQL1_9HYPH|nr:ImmA/IrrE family metallo-endopeptidase [Youhaiella tibetensis]GGF15867.1 ImmA/IrrE family metallo-endopeptidase [Youhaiella tibetensis]